MSFEVKKELTSLQLTLGMKVADKASLNQSDLMHDIEIAAIYFADTKTLTNYMTNPEALDTIKEEKVYDMSMDDLAIIVDFFSLKIYSYKTKSQRSILEQMQKDLETLQKYQNELKQKTQEK